MTNPSPLESQTTSENVNEGALTNSRIQHSVESLKEQMKLTEEELQFRIKNFDSADSKEHSKYFKCTKCGVSFQSKINKGEELSVHPLLDVLMCVSCCDYYGNGEFSLDSDGEDKYCRWCGEGGTLFSCSKCICAFCKKCIKKHFDVSGLEKVEKDDDWVCYFCDVKPLWHMRWVCSLAKEKSEINRKELGSKQQETKVIKKRKRRRIYESNSDLNINTSDGSESNNNAKSTNAGPSKILRKKRLRRSLRSNICFDSSSSCENEKENLENSFKRKNSLRSRKSERSENTLESESKNLQKRSKLEEVPTTEQPDESSITERNRFLVVDKFKGVWKLTQIVAEICLRYSKERLEVLSQPSHIKSLSDLKEEYEKLRSVTTMVSSTIHKACDSVESLKSDLSCKSVKDESHVFQCEEANLKSLAKKLFSESEEEGQSDYSVKNVKNKYSKRKERKSEETENKSCSLFGVLDSENENGENGRKTTSEKGENSIADKRPVLKVKDFAKMNNENIFKEESKEEGGPRDSEKQNQTNEYDVDTDTEESSGVEEVKNEKNNKDVSGSESSGISGKTNRAKTRSSKDKEVLKDKFYEFREKRVKYLKSASQRTKSSVKSTEKNEFFEGSGDDKSENNGENSNRKRKKRKQILSSDEENKNEKTESESEASFVLSEENENDSDVGSSSGEANRKTGSRRKGKKNQNGNKDESSKSGNEDKSGDGDDEDDGNDTGNKNGKKGRRNIKKILKKDSLKLTTKEALKNEENRRKRIEERHKLLKNIMNENGNGENAKDNEDSAAKKLILDFDVETQKPLVSVHDKLMRKLKSHQIEGVRFMWDNCFESVEQSEKESGSGCILAHYMGLGKTLQVVTLVHTIMTHDIGVNTVLIICPLGIVNNWSKEFELWLSEIKTKAIMLYDMNHCKSSESRCSQLREWHKTGGVMVLSYDLFRTLTMNQTKTNKLNRTQKVYVETLLDPGPDVVVCDEGHLLKNEDTALSKCVNRIKTARRIVLTGTPLQNNLREYHCMVQFVKPNILGTKKEFANRFINPITNGQFEDSTEQDVRVMKRRSHVLHSMLEGCVQRFDYSVLTPYLPEKQEYVLSISLTEAQAQAYRHFIENLSTRMSKGSKTATLFNDYHNLQRIWTHPRVLLMHKEKETQKVDNILMKSSLNKFVVNSDEETPSASDESSDEASVEEIITEKRVLRSNSSGLNLEKNSKVIENELSADVKNEWWSEYFKDSDYEDIRASNKLLALFFLLKSFGEAGDKALVFSQSLYSLDLIEHFLNKIDDQNDESFSVFKDNWVHGIDYFRLDGTTNSDLRTSWCEIFNKKSNKRARLFLISTKAGGLGINLFSANRVIVFDASWNPSHDLQSIFRVYRFGQKKTCYVYRFLAEATMEEKIYERQVTKLSLSHRVVDELQIERHYSMMNLQELYNFAPTPKEMRKMPKIPKDKILADLIFTYHDAVVDYHEHDSLLENKEEEELTEEERKTAWQEFEQEKEQKVTLSNLSSLKNMYSSGTVQAIPGDQAQTSSSFYSPLQTQIPLQILERGFKVGLIPFYGETTEAYTTRVLNRELFLGTSQRET